MDTIMARYFQHYLRVSGIFFNGSINKRRSKNIIWDTCQVLSAVSTSFLIMVMLTDYCLFYSRDVSTMDFFVVVAFINRSSYSCQAVLLFLIFFIQRHQIRKILSEISVNVREVLAPEETRKWLFRSSLSVICWLLLCHGAHSTIVYILVVHSLAGGKGASDVVSVFGADERYTMPKWIFYTLSAICNCLTLNIELAGQLFCFVIISLTTRVMVKINHIVSYQCLVEPKVTVDALDATMSLIRWMRRLYRRFNQTFGYIIFVNCVRDLIALLALMSLLLRTNDPQKPGENPEDYDSRLKGNEVIERMYLCQTVISVANAVVRCFLCVHSQKQVHVSAQIPDRILIPDHPEPVATLCAD